MAVLKLRIPDVTFLGGVALVATAQAHYWNNVWRFGGPRHAEYLFQDLSLALLTAMSPATDSADVAQYAKVDALTSVLVVLGYLLPAVAILLPWRARRPRLAAWLLRGWTLFYVAWLLVLSPVEYRIQ